MRAVLALCVPLVLATLINGIGRYNDLKANLNAKYLADLKEQKPKSIQGVQRYDSTRPFVRKPAPDNTSPPATGTSAYSAIQSKYVADFSTQSASTSQNLIMKTADLKLINTTTWAANSSTVHSMTSETGNKNQTIYDADIFYQLATSIHNKNKNSSFNIRPLSVLHLIRVPKASSSSLSAVARRAVGCHPPGPCCKYPGMPVGTCPRRDLFKCKEENKVIGCTHHSPNLLYIFKDNIPSISMMRNPYSRSISAFFYPGIHHNVNCVAGHNECFVQYTQNPKWQNIVTKMLCGDDAYAPRSLCTSNITCIKSFQKAEKNLQYLTFMGVAEMWELSLLVLHQKLPSLPPDLSEFRMGTQSEDSHSQAARVNMKPGYAEFRATALEKFEKELQNQNALDVALYRVVVQNLCESLHELHLWEYEVVRVYWRKYAPMVVNKCI